jgi:hypothetical protein
MDQLVIEVEKGPVFCLFVGFIKPELCRIGPDVELRIIFRVMVDRKIGMQG